MSESSTPLPATAATAPAGRARTTLVGQLLLGLVAATTTWIALLSWRGFIAQPVRYEVPLIAIGLVIAVVGALARWWRLPGPVVVLAQVVVSGMVTSAILCGSPIPVGHSWHELVTAIHEAVTSANQFAPPVPSGVPSVHPLLVAGGLGCLLAADIFACTLRRVPLAGLPLLTVFSIPISELGHGPTWWVFALTSAGFLTMLYLHEADRVARWGRPLLTEPGTDSAGASASSAQRSPRVSAGAIGGVATALAIVVPLAIPTLDVHPFSGFGIGSGGDGNITINNPMVSLQRDLRRGDDVTLLTLHTDDPDPSYLRIAVLTYFQDDQWRAGDRDVPSTNQANSQLPPLVGVNTAVKRERYSYDVTATPGFDSTWLPTTQNVGEVDVAGDWRYDPNVLDFLAASDNLNVSGMNYHFTGVDLDLDPSVVAQAGPAGALVPDVFTDVPNDLDPMVRKLALEVTRNAPSRFQKAIALQDWFRDKGGFVYDDSVDLGDGSDDLVRFLSEGPHGRRGYCQQFAAAMAVMARTMNIPARVAVGFLHPTRSADGTYVYSAHDLHAWPELFFPGAGWVRFEPTPAGRTGTAPNYTTEQISVPNPSVVRDSPSLASAQPTDRPINQGDKNAKKKVEASSGSAVPWGRLGAGLGLVLLLLVAALGPRSIRSRRRERRSSSGAEDAWAELRDTAIDLALPWPQDRSPRQTRDALVRWFGAPPDEFTPEVPRRGADTNPDAVVALDRIVLALERLRYARADGTPPGTWRAEIDTCSLALTGGAPRRQRLLARWWPRSVLARNAPIRVRPADRTEVSAPGKVVDHVG